MSVWRQVGECGCISGSKWEYRTERCIKKTCYRGGMRMKMVSRERFVVGDIVGVYLGKKAFHGHGFI